MKIDRTNVVCKVEPYHNNGHEKSRLFFASQSGSSPHFIHSATRPIGRPVATKTIGRAFCYDGFSGRWH